MPFPTLRGGACLSTAPLSLSVSLSLALTHSLSLSRRSPQGLKAQNGKIKESPLSLVDTSHVAVHLSKPRLGGGGGGGGGGNRRVLAAAMRENDSWSERDSDVDGMATEEVRGGYCVVEPLVAEGGGSREGVGVWAHTGGGKG